MPATPRTPGTRWRGDITYALFLFVWLLIVALLWLADPSHRTGADSRASWPETRDHQP